MLICCLFHEREGYDISNAGAVGQQHHQPVHAYSQAAGWGEAVLERREEVVVNLDLMYDGSDEELRTYRRWHAFSEVSLVCRSSDIMFKAASSAE